MCVKERHVRKSVFWFQNTDGRMMESERDYAQTLELKELVSVLQLMDAYVTEIM